MKFICQKNEFEKKLTQALRFTSSSITQIPSLQGVKIVGDKKNITFYSTNLNDFYSTTCEAQVEKEGSVVFDGKKVLEFLKIAHDTKFTFELKNNTCLITLSHSKGVFQLYNAEDYPEMPITDGKKSDFPKELIKNLHLVLFSASKDDMRPVLSGVYFTPSSDGINMVSTDGFRLTLVAQKVKNDNFPSFIISSRFLNELTSFLKEAKKTEFSFVEDKKIVAIHTNESSFVTRVIEGDFPPYEKVIPTTKSTSFIVDKEEFLQNMRLISIFARDLSNIVVCSVSKKELLLKTKTAEEKDSQTKLGLRSFEGTEMQTAFNYKFIIDFLTIIDAKEIQVEYTNTTAPGVFKIVGRDDFIHIIMPLRTEE